MSLFKEFHWWASWSTTNWFAKLSMLVIDTVRFLLVILNPWSLRGQRVSYYSMLSSTCYSIAGTAHKRTEGRSILLVSHWYVLGGLCYLLMEPIANRMMRVAGGMKITTADQLNIYQSIKRRRGKDAEALSAIIMALGKNEMSPHTRGLLLVGKADIAVALGGVEVALNDLSQAATIAKEGIDLKVEQRASIFKGISRVFRRMRHFEEAEAFRRKAIATGEECGARDQIAKAS